MLAEFLGDKIALVRYVRNITAPMCSLVEAKAIVEQFQIYVNRTPSYKDSPFRYLTDLGKLVGRYNRREIGVEGGVRLIWLTPNAVTFEQLDELFAGNRDKFNFNPFA